jgi:hypothetical protein
LRCLIESRLSGAQRDFGLSVLASGSQLERATLDWCLQNKPLLDDVGNIDLVVTYEQMVMEPQVVVDRVIDVLGLQAAQDIRQGVHGLSRSVAISDSSRLALLEKRHRNPCDLVTRWQRDVTQEQMHAMDRVLDRLEIDAYSASDPWPAKRFWIRPSGEAS